MKGERGEGEGRGTREKEGLRERETREGRVSEKKLPVELERQGKVKGGHESTPLENPSYACYYATVVPSTVAARIIFCSMPASMYCPQQKYYRFIHIFNFILHFFTIMSKVNSFLLLILQSLIK